MVGFPESSGTLPGELCLQDGVTSSCGCCSVFQVNHAGWKRQRSSCCRFSWSQVVSWRGFPVVFSREMGINSPRPNHTWACREIWRCVGDRQDKKKPSPSSQHRGTPPPIARAPVVADPAEKKSAEIIWAFLVPFTGKNAHPFGADQHERAFQ